MFGGLAIALVYGLWYFALGGITGSVVGLTLAIPFRLPRRGVWKDALLGGFGMLIGFLVAALLPFPENTRTYKIGEVTVADTMNQFQHPYYLAFLLAVAFPVIRAISNAKRRPSHSR